MIQATFDPDVEIHGAGGQLHGGISALLLDTVMARLGKEVDKVTRVTASLNIKYRQPIPLDGREISVDAWRDNKHVRKVYGRIVRADGVVAVEASGLFVPKPRAEVDRGDIKKTRGAMPLAPPIVLKSPGSQHNARTSAVES